ncbi:hypothetical protein [Mesobacillus subterraneus]|nr:hypothetical protein [Mesobacillus subterraneus]
MEFFIGIIVIVTIFSLEIQLRKLNQTNEKILQSLNELKNAQK